MVEVSSGLAHEAVVLPWLRNQNHHGQRQFHAVHIQKFKSVIQHGRIRSAAVDDREDLVDILFHVR